MSQLVNYSIIEAGLRALADKAHESAVAQFIKDMVDDADQKDGFIFNRFYADCCHNGVPIPWEDVL